MSRAWEQDDIDWAVGCAAAGDTVAEIAEMADRAPDDVHQQFETLRLRPLTARQREVAACWAAGMSSVEIDRHHGVAKGSAHRSLRLIAAKGYPVDPAAERMAIKGTALDAMAARLGATDRYDLARRLGLSPSRIRNLSRDGVSARMMREVQP